MNYGHDADFSKLLKFMFGQRFFPYFDPCKWDK